MTRILIAGASSGWGHMQAALNLEGWFTRLFPRVSASVVDAFDHVSMPAQLITRDLWQMISLRWPGVYREIYPSLTRGSLTAKATSRCNVLSMLLGRLDLESFDAVIATHPLALLLGTMMKSRSSCRLFVVPTDYVFHDLYRTDNVDAYFVSSHAILPNILAESTGCRARQTVYDVGIPLSPRFEDAFDQNAARRSLGLDPNRFTVLVSFGGAGLRLWNNICLIKELVAKNHFVQWVVLTGHDQTLHRKVSSVLCNESCANRVLVKGFTDDVVLLMSAADAIVGKPGGLTVSEAIRMKLPFAIIDRLPGQEDHNATFVRKFNVGIETSDCGCISDWLAQLADRQVMETWKARFKPLEASPAGRLIATHVMDELGSNVPAPSFAWNLALSRNSWQ